MAGLEVLFTRKRVKNINLRIRPSTGEVCVSASPLVPRRVVENFVASRSDWIAKAQQRVQDRRDLAEPELAVGSHVLFLGDRYELCTGSISATGIHQDKLILNIPQDAVPERVDKALNDFYRKELLIKLPTLADYWEQMVGAKASEYKVRRMKTRWGSCNTHTHRINLSLELIKYPLACIEYVLVHELTHLLEPSHNSRFHRLVTEVMPDWKARKAFLNKGV